MLGVPYSELSSNQWELVFQGGLENKYAGKVYLKTIAKSWESLQEMLLLLWRPDVTNAAYSKLDTNGRRLYPRNGRLWSENEIEGIIKNHITRNQWKIISLQKLIYSRNCFSDGPLQRGDAVWAISSLNRHEKTMVVGFVEEVECFFAPNTP